MNQKFRIALFLLLALNISFSQDKVDVLLTVNDEPVKTSEFLRVYNKNLDLVKDESQKDIDGYLKLFIEYQLKLQEAKRLKLNEEEKYQREFSNYKKQLTKNYLSENKVTDALVEEAYERSKQDINASHILVRLDESATDTLNAYNQVLELRERVLNEGFDAVKAQEHNGTTIFLEDLGYFSAFKMVYDFENAAYNTPVGEISMPFRTQFGYHVVNVKDKRSSRGTITAAHIMVALQQKDSTLNPEQRINEIYKKIEQGESFEALAKQFSDDKSSARNGGKLSPFKSGQLSSTIFEDVAFGLDADGDISKPFKSNFGWHIVKRIELEPIASFDELKPQFESRVQRDSRSKLINKAMIEELKTRYEISYDPNAKAYFDSILNNNFFKGSWELPKDFDESKFVFAINTQPLTYKEFGNHLLAAQRLYLGKNTPLSDVLEKEYNSFFEKSLLNYRENNLELESEEFAGIIQEYRDGLLLFDLMEKEVWNKAAKDSVGLQNYYQANKGNYKWKERVDVLIASSADKLIANDVLSMMNKGVSREEINKTLNSGTKQNILFTAGIYSADDPKFPSNFVVHKGPKLYEYNEAFHVINVKEIVPEKIKSLEEAKGNVINDYQQELEAAWLAQLYDRFDVKVNKKELKRIKKQIKNQ
ncbi:peptidylprolyl isomerase [Winogradskyella ursingii]|uniref:peptidylprolyl isomerase n=1 Tax=Winogradskyella ursingii TaxID=2686079 RepID=UPI0015C6B7F6|nr:peptidylprolyl isomerase [Winogradskyella ursingii]